MGGQSTQYDGEAKRNYVNCSEGGVHSNSSIRRANFNPLSGWNKEVGEGVANSVHRIQALPSQYGGFNQFYTMGMRVGAKSNEFSADKWRDLTGQFEWSQIEPVQCDGGQWRGKSN